MRTIAEALKMSISFAEAMRNGYNVQTSKEVIDACTEALEETTKSKWISVKDRFPEYLEGKDYSANVLGICKLSETHSYMGIFCLNIIEYTEDGHLYAWAKLDRCWDDLRQGECEFDDDYEITHWMPLPENPNEQTN